MGDVDHPRRRCGVGVVRHGQGETCGALATVVCTDDTGFAWFACDEPEHRRAFYAQVAKLAGAVEPDIAVRVEPIAEWFAKLFAREP